MKHISKETLAKRTEYIARVKKIQLLYSCSYRDAQSVVRRIMDGDISKYDEGAILEYLYPEEDHGDYNTTIVYTLMGPNIPTTRYYIDALGNTIYLIDDET